MRVEEVLREKFVYLFSYENFHSKWVSGDGRLESNQQGGWGKSEMKQKSCLWGGEVCVSDIKKLFPARISNYVCIMFKRGCLISSSKSLLFIFILRCVDFRLTMIYTLGTEMLCWLLRTLLIIFWHQWIIWDVHKMYFYGAKGWNGILQIYCESCEDLKVYFSQIGIFKFKHFTLEFVNI